MAKRKTIPNYKFIHDSLISDLQIAFQEYKETYKKHLDSMWIGKDGKLCVLSNTKGNLDEKAREFIAASNRLRDFENIHGSDF